MASVVTAFADKVVHVTLSGKMLQGNEEWQTGFYMGLAQGEAPVPTQEFVDGVRDLWQTFWTTPGNAIAAQFTFEQVKAARLGKDGRYDGTAVPISYPTAPVAGGSSGNPLPPQIALVATLIAGSGKGLAGKGRMYLPGVRQVVDDSGHLLGTTPQTIATNLTTFFNGIRTLSSAPGVPINASRGSVKLLGADARNVPINGVRVGNVYDTQRRRRNQLQETYSVGGLIGT